MYHNVFETTTTQNNNINNNKTWLFHCGVNNNTAAGRVAQSVTCLAADASLTADPGVASSIPARSHTFVEIDHEIISPFHRIIQEGLLSVTSEVCARSTG